MPRGDVKLQRLEVVLNEDFFLFYFLFFIQFDLRERFRATRISGRVKGLRTLLLAKEGVRIYSFWQREITRAKTQSEYVVENIRPLESRQIARPWQREGQNPQYD